MKTKRMTAMICAFIAIALVITGIACNAISNTQVDKTSVWNIEESRVLGRKAAADAGIVLPQVTWNDIENQREADPEGRPSVYWIGSDILYTRVDGVELELTPAEAIERYGADERFVREYAFLMM